VAFYGFEMVKCGLGVLPPIFGSIEACKALDDGRPVTFVRSRPDIIAYHLAGSSDFSNVDELEADLRAIEQRAAEPGELRMLELRHVENGRIPFGIFEPVSGWPIRDMIGFVRCEVPLAAAIALHIYRSYSGGPNVVTPEGAVVREMLPHFSHIFRSETPSFIGNEPDISITGRIHEARSIFAQVSRDERAAPGVMAGFDNADSTAGGVAFEAEMEAVAGGVDFGPAFAALLASRYNFVSPWRSGA
jgi:hypothetical protein